MKVSHLTGSVTQQGGGIPIALLSLVSKQKQGGLGPAVFGWDEGRESLKGWPDGVLRSLIVEKKWGLPSGKGMRRAVLAEGADLLHLHGLWTGSSLVTGRAAVPYVVSPHGMLDPWALALSRWKKKLAGFAFEKRNLKGAACLHALCESEAKAMRDYGLTNPIAVIPNGVDLPEVGSLGEGYSGGRKTLLFLGRLHPKKGLANALRAWAELWRNGEASSAKSHEQSLGEAWRFVIAGWDEGGHGEELKSLCDELGLVWCELSGEEFLVKGGESRVNGGEVVFLGSVFGEKKDALLRASDAFILPSYSEGLPMAVLEAWSYRLPVLMTEACHLEVGFEREAAIRIGTDCDSITAGLRRCFEMSEEELAQLGGKGRKLTAEEFSWQEVARKFEEVYRWVLAEDGVGRPDFVWGGDV